MESANKTVCHQEAQEESSNPAALIELKFANLLKQIQQQTVQQETVQPKEFPFLSLSFREVLDFLEEYVQVASEPSTSNLAPSPKKSQLSNYQPLASQNLEDTSGEELTKFLKQSKQETGVIPSEPLVSNMCPSLKRTKVSDYHPSTRQSTAGPSCVMSTATRERYIVVNKPYIKKPLNAYMLFWAEQRQRVSLELGIKDCARVNMVLGRKWKMLSKEEKVPYFEQALREKRALQARYPDCYATDIFGKKVRQRNTVAPNYHHSDFPANQPWPYATSPMIFPPQVPYHQGPYYPTWGPSQHPFYQPGAPNQGPYYQPGAPNQGPYYQPGGASQGPNH